MRDVRENAQEEARRIVEEHIDVQWSDTFTREEAKDSLGHSWSNICDIVPAGYAMCRGIENAIEALEDEDYYTSLDADDGTIAIKVSVGMEAYKRNKEVDE